MVDFNDIWTQVKQGTVSERDVAAAESALRSSSETDRHLPLLIVGVTRRPDPSLIKLVKSILLGDGADAERYCALRVLCRYWGLWEDFLPYVLEKISPEGWESDYGVSNEAFNLVGEYLWEHADRNAWRRLVSVYDAAVASGRQDLAKNAYAAIVDGIYGKKEALMRSARKQFREHDKETLNAARLKAGLAH